MTTIPSSLPPLVALLVLTLFLATRPARGPGSVDASPYLQAAVIGSSLAWGILCHLLSARVLADAVPGLSRWVSIGVGVAVFGLWLWRLGGPWHEDGDVPGSPTRSTTA